MKKGGYVIVDSEGYLNLTASGYEIAEKMYERHTILTDYLVLLGVDKNAAAEDACKIEHVISDESFEAIKKHIRRNNN